MKIEVVEHIVSFKFYVFGKLFEEFECEFGIMGVIKFASNENLFGFLSKVIEVIECVLLMF